MTAAWRRSQRAELEQAQARLREATDRQEELEREHFARCKAEGRYPYPVPVSLDEDHYERQLHDLEARLGVWGSG